MGNKTEIKIVPEEDKIRSSEKSPGLTPLEQALDKALEVGDDIGVLARQKFGEILDRIPPLPLNKSEFENLQKSDPEVAGVLQLEQGKIMNEIGKTLEAIRLAEHKDPHGVHYEVAQNLYKKLQNLKANLPLSDIGDFDSKVLTQSPIPEIELNKLESTASLKTKLVQFANEHYANLQKILPDILIEKIEDFMRGFATGIIKLGADVTELIKALYDHPEEFFRSLKVFLALNITSATKEASNTISDGVIELVDSTLESEGGNLAFDTGYVMSNSLSFFVGSMPIKAALVTIKNAPKLAPQLVDPIALLQKRKNYLSLVAKIRNVYPQINALTAQKIVSGLVSVLSSYPKADQSRLINNALEDAVFQDSSSLFNDKSTLKLFVDTAYTLPDKERRDVVITMMSIHKPLIVKTVEPLLVTLTKDDVYKYLGIV